MSLILQTLGFSTGFAYGHYKYKCFSTASVGLATKFGVWLGWSQKYSADDALVHFLITL